MVSNMAESQFIRTALVLKKSHRSTKIHHPLLPLLEVQRVRNPISISQMGQLVKQVSAGLTAAPLVGPLGLR